MRISIGWVAAASLLSSPTFPQDRRDDGRRDDGRAGESRSDDGRSRSNDGRPRSYDGRQINGQDLPLNDARRNPGVAPTIKVGRGYVPAHGPQPVRAAPDSNRAPQDQRFGEQGRDFRDRGRGFRDQPQHPEVPHVHPQRDEWVGHDTGRNDARYRLGRPWAHGRFRGGFGPRYVYRLDGGDPERFAIEGQYFAVAQPDLELVSDWDFDDDDIVLYADPDHDGYYLAYDTRLGTYVHVEYLGQ